MCYLETGLKRHEEILLWCLSYFWQQYADAVFHKGLSSVFLILWSVRGGPERLPLAFLGLLCFCGCAEYENCIFFFFFLALPCSPEWNGLIRTFWRSVGNYHGVVVDEVSGGFILK